MRVIVVFLLILINSVPAYAADFNILPQSGVYSPRSEFSVNIKIDTSDKTINAAQAKIKFPVDTFEIKSILKDGSIFNFWLQEPEFSNTEGTIEFIGGTPNGVSGAALQVLKINFVTKGTGSGELFFLDSAITAADGTGDNILNDANGAAFSISAGSGSVPPPATESGTVVVTPIPAPVQIKRTAIKVSGLPLVPTIKIALYPDPIKWYSLVSAFTASWDLPADISELSTALNGNPNYTVPANSEGLFDNKTFPAIIDDGVYYLHVRFKNNIGWGPTAHHRVAIDTQPPLPFKIDVKTGLSNDDPSPVLSFQTGDALSGIDSYIVNITGEEPIILTSGNLTNESQLLVSENQQQNQLKILETGVGYLNVRSGPGTSNGLVGKVYPSEIYEYTDQANGWYKIDSGWIIDAYTEIIGNIDKTAQVSAFKSEYKLKPHSPGLYMISVKAVDMAGNSVEDMVEVEVLPIKSPEITFITKEIIKGSEDLLTIKGIAAPEGSVIVTIKDKKDFLIAQNEANTDKNGEWEFRFDQELRSGLYSVTLMSKDSRGALSYPTDPVQIRYKDKPIIVLGGWEITFRDLIILLVVIGLGGAGYYWRKTLLHITRAHREAIIIKRDISNAFANVKQSLKKYGSTSTDKNVSKEEKENELKNIEESLEKVEKYVGKDIENLE